MADIFSAIVGCFGVSSQIDEFVVTPLWNQFRYLFHHNDLIQKLRDEVEKLDNDTASLQLKIDAARKNLEVIHGNVKTWISTAAAKKAEADTILGAAAEGQNGTCLSGTCPNLMSRYSSGKQAKKMTDDVRQLREECGKFERVSDPAPRTGIETIPPTTSGISEFETRKRKEEEIMACLRDDTILMIGICGMGGVGKTTMGNKIVKRASKERLFDETVKAVVSQQANLLKIQQQIAGALCLKLEEEKSESVIANQLHERLSDQKRVLLFLDDVWERLDLGELGIPAHCKIILTSRDQDVCIQMMTTKDATEILSLDGLSIDESWVLFRENSGSVVDEPGLRPLAVDVAKECKGLPLALATVGRAMREKTSKADWEDALLQLRRAAPTNIRGVNKYVYQPLQLSYDALESDEARYFFLLCCLFPEDSNFDIERLVHYGVALRIFTSTTSIREARNRAHGLVKMLKNRFLLMDADQSHLRHRSVKMHDVVRDMALSIARSGKHAFMVSHDRGLKAWPDNDSHCEDITCISLDLGEETIIPKRINYPRLKALHLDIAGGFEQRKLPESFLDGVTGLRFLNIPHVVSSLSLEKLIDLRVLHLPSYESGTIPSLGDMVNLEILRLHGPYIEVLPKEIRALTNLKVLNLNEFSWLKNIAPGVLSRLFQLEELRLLACPIQWEVEERGSERSNASLAEVFSLRNLSLLEIRILGLEMIPQDAVCLKKLTSYSINVGDGYSLSTIDEILDEKHMFVRLNERNVGVHAMSALFVGAETLDLGGSGTQDIVDRLARQGFQNVKVLIINNLDTRKHLATTTELLESTFRPTCGVFPVLRELSITSMKELEEICHGPPIVGSFSALQHLRIYSLRSLTHLWKDPRGEVCVPNLKWIKIFECTNLKWVFPLFSVAKSLSQLEEIQIEDCPNLEEVFKDERVLEDGVTTFHHISFQKLGRMILKNLPKLSTLCKAIDVFEFPSIEFLEIHRSPNLKFLAHQQPFLPNKQHGIGSTIGLCGLEIRSALKGHINVRILRVSDCSILEEIVEFEHNKEEQGSVMIDKTIIPLLRILELSKLPKLRYFCTFINCLELPSLEELIIENCPMMETFAFESSDNNMPNSIPFGFFRKEVIYPKLHKVVLKGLNFSTPIFCHEIPTSSFNALTRLNVESCHSLKRLFSPKIFRQLTKLEKLEIKDCSMLEEVIFEEEEIVQVGGGLQENEMVWNLPKLKKLALCKLPKMVRFSYLESDLELPLLKRIEIQQCTELMSSLALGLRYLPDLTQLCGISDPKLASRFFFDKELTEDDGCLNHGCFKLFQSDFKFIPFRHVELFLVKGLSNELFFDGWRMAYAKFEKLTPKVTYEIVFVIMLTGELVDGKFKLLIEIEGLEEDKMYIREEDMRDKPVKQWIEILGGEFTPSSSQYGQLFSVTKRYQRGDGLLLKAAYIRPKEVTA